MDNDKKLGLVTNVLAKNAARVNTLQSDLDNVAENVNKKIGLITNVLAKNAARVKNVQNDLIRVEDKVNVISKSINDDIARINKKLSLVTNVLAKNAGRVKGLTTEAGATPEGKGSLSISSSLGTIAASLLRINNSLSKIAGGKSALDTKVTPAGVGAAPTGVGAVPEKDKEETGIFGLFKSLFTNPAVIAALVGIVYTILPKDIQDKIKAFLGGFVDGLDDAMGKNEQEGFNGLNTAIKVAGAALAVVFGAKVIGGIASAITTTLKIIRMLGAGGKMLGKMGAAGKIVVAGGAAIGAAAMMGGGEGDGTATTSKPEPSAGGADIPPSGGAPAPEAKPATGGIKPSGGGGFGIKPGATLGMKVPEMTGEDKPVMAMIKQHEGVRTSPYKDSLGLWTVGVGHLIGDGKSLPPEYNRQFSMDEVDNLFASDYQHHKEAAKKIPGYEKLDNSGKAALIDLTFNMGPAWYRKWPNFTKALSEGDTQTAAKSLEDSKWYTQVGNRARTIVALIRGSGTVEGTTTAEATPTKEVGAEPVSTASNSGKAVAASTQSAKEGKEFKPVSQVASNSQTNNVEPGKKSDLHAPIPSPIADRGSLMGATRHSTAYA